MYDLAPGISSLHYPCNIFYTEWEMAVMTNEAFILPDSIILQSFYQQPPNSYLYFQVWMSGPYHSGNSRKMQILHAEYVIYIHTSMPVITDKIVEQLVLQGNKNAWGFLWGNNGNYPPPKGKQGPSYKVWIRNSICHTIFPSCRLLKLHYYNNFHK